MNRYRRFRGGAGDRPQVADINMVTADLLQGVLNTLVNLVAGEPLDALQTQENR